MIKGDILCVFVNASSDDSVADYIVNRADKHRDLLLSKM